MDKYYVYRPLLDLVGKSEGTDKGRGYNETLAYGKLTGGPVDLIKLTLTQIDALQTRMLQHPANKWNSSAVGRYQIVRTTLRSIRNTLGLAGSELYNASMQDRLACYLLGVRGIDKWLAGRLSTDTMLLNLAKEWASLPAPEGKGFYGGQNASVSVQQVKDALSQVRVRHESEHPPVEVIPPKVDDEVQKKTGLWQWLTGLFGGGGIGLGWFAGMDRDALLAFGGVVIVVLLLILVLRRQIIAAIRELREGLQ